MSRKLVRSGVVKNDVLGHWYAFVSYEHDNADVIWPDACIASSDEMHGPYATEEEAKAKLAELNGGVP